MSKHRVVLVCPGRGSYTDKSRGSLPAKHAWVEKADALRGEYGLEPLSELDAAPRFDPSRHLRPAHASALIYLLSMLDGAEAMRDHRVVGIVGNSLGWYTTLALGGALSFEDGFRLVQEMSLLQEDISPGGQLIYPQIDETWRRDPDRVASVESALASSGGGAFHSIHLGGYAVLAGSEAGVDHLMRTLPPVQMGSAKYPIRLAKHGPYHTPLAAEVAHRARKKLQDMKFRAPKTTLIDGRGVRFTPWSTDPAELRDYTIEAQIKAPYDFSRSVQVSLRELAPARLVLPGPGNTLGGVCAQIVIAEGWRGITDRAAFDAVQASEDPILVSMRR